MFIMQKLIRGTNYDRSVYITKDRKIGKCLKIKSKNGEFKEKNVFPLFFVNPCEKITMNIEDEQNFGLRIVRKSDTPVTLTSKNSMVLDLLFKEINIWINGTYELKNLINKWSICLLNSMARCVHILQTKKKFSEQIKLNEKTQNVLVNKISLSRALISIRYLAHLLENGKVGYNNLKKIFFKTWYNQWNCIAVRNIIKNKHKLIQNKLNFFNYTKHKQNIGQRYKNNIDDIYDKLNTVNEDFTSIFSNLTQLINTRSITDDIQSETVSNLQQIADLRHRIETINNTGEEFIIIGDQSSGKSSLLCMLLGVNIAYTDNLFATRCPVRYLLEPCDPKVGWKFEFEDPRSKVFTTVSQEELQKKLITHFKSTIGRNIVSDPLTIKIWSPTCTSSMTLVDLPGLVGNSDTNEKQEQHKNSYAIVKDYLNRPNIFILFVHRFDVDIGSLNTSILDEVKNRNKNNVIYCLTHFDRCCSDQDITYDNIYNNILQCSSEIANGNDMFLLSLSKYVNDLKSKEDISGPTIKYLTEHYGDILQHRNIHFNLDSVKIFLRKKLHRHVLEINIVLQEFLCKQRDILLSEYNIFNNKYLTPKVSDEILEQFNSLFKNKTQKLLKGHLIPEKQISEHCFFEDLKSEVKNANIFSLRNNISIWPSLIMIKTQSRKNNPNIQSAITTPCNTTVSSQTNTPRSIITEITDTSNNDLKIDVNVDGTKKEKETEKERKPSKPESEIPIVYDNGLDKCLTRDIISHALFTRTVYELQKRLCCIEITPSPDDIRHGITYDPNINLDTPKDSAHCVMIHTVKKQLNMNKFFDYAIKRFEYITYKILRYSIWNINNTDETDPKCLTLLDSEEFQFMFEIEINNYIEKLCKYTKEKFSSSFDEIMNSPIVISHADRYKKMLINDFNWSESEIEECNNEEIFKPKNIGVHNIKNAIEIENDDNERINKICNLIKLHIHVRLLMMCELMTIHVDYNWRRMLDDTKDSSTNDNNNILNSIFEHIRKNVCKNISVNNTNYNNDQILKIYNGNSDCKVDIDEKKIDEIHNLLDSLHEYNEKIPEILMRSVSIAGDKFL
tara:strand:- start:429 stop:3638 length:3210 start_codon:yes stop_codon:yes gene_type:complete